MKEGRKRENDFRVFLQAKTIFSDFSSRGLSHMPYTESSPANTALSFIFPYSQISRFSFSRAEKISWILVLVIWRQKEPEEIRGKYVFTLSYWMERLP